MNVQSSEQKSGYLVLPGERIGVIEEFIPNSRTYVKDGVIYSKVVGRALIDFLNKKVSVYPLMRGASVPRVSTIVLGQVSSTQTENATVRIFKIGQRKLSGTFTGILHISNVQRRYVESMHDVCKVGDIVRAEVISEKNQVYHLSTDNKGLGVVYAFCSQCGRLLEPKRNGMQCGVCGKIEKRKVASDYGKEIL
ncbi:MAG: exosome complex RNA-binding protein Csl4 [Candidatus Bathycorpusculaceae bacterium]